METNTKGISEQFNKEPDRIGPYNVAQYSQPVMTAAQFGNLSEDQRTRILSDRQSIFLHSAALEDSDQDQNLGELPIKLSEQYISLQRALDLGKTLPPSKKLELVKDILNENVTYSSAEADADIPRRPNVPMPDVIDYAQTSRETLGNGHGDCEDYAILGADLLKRMGMPPQDVQILSGAVYNNKGEHLFDHANLAVKTAPNSWDISELVNDKASILPASSYLQNGLKGQLFFVPSISIGGDASASSFHVPQPDGLPKDRFEPEQTPNKPPPYPQNALTL